MKTVLVMVFAVSAGLAAMACAHARAEKAGDALASLSVEPGTVDLNSANEADLIALPGIGPMKADAILAYRKKHGVFRRVEDLRNVKGFGRKSVARLRPMVTVGGPPATAAAPANATEARAAP